MKNQETDNTTKITSFKLAAYLIANGHTLLDIVSTNNPKRKAFVLQGNNTTQIMSDFYSDKKVKKFIEAERELKERLYNQT